MTMTGLLLKLAIIPPLFLILAIYRMDKVEREPLGLLLLLLIIGGVSTVPAAFLEELLAPLYTGIESAAAARAVHYFVVVAVIEEALKFIVLKKCTWNHKAFDYTFDGVVYGVTVSMGFALVENVLYASQYGMRTVLTRAFTAILLHAVCGVCMGIYYGRAGQMRGAGKNLRAKILLIKGLVFSILIHGFYDFCAGSPSDRSLTVLLVFLFVLYTAAFLKIRSFQRNDTRIREETDENSR